MTYNNSVLVGNWSEERLKNEYEFKIFLRKRERKELLLQKSRTLFSNLLKERPLLISGAYVLFGYNVQLVASDMLGNKVLCSIFIQKLSKPCHYFKSLSQPTANIQFFHWFFIVGSGYMIFLREKLADFTAIQEDLHDRNCVQQAPDYFTHDVRLDAKATEPNGKPQYGLALSSLVNARQVDYMQNINDGCLMTMSSITTPCCRNTFVIVSTADESLRGEKMVFGDEFYLKAENYGDPTAPALYVRYVVEGAPSPPNRMPLRLSSVKDSCCRFTAIPLLPCDRLEAQGTAVQTGTRLIVKNCVADQNLCVMNQLWMQTFFGPECGVTCRNYIDIHKRFTAENIFQLVSDVETKSMKEI